MSKVVPLISPNRLNRGGSMDEMKIGNSIVIMNPCEASEEEQEHAQYELHMVLYEIMDELIERGEAS